ncbi:MAG: preprotein translocase subunit SecE [Candidatus Uhrbacteria bacterium]
MTESTKKGLNPIKYLKEAKEELGKVTWPSKKDTIRYSVIVVCVTAGMAIFFTILDWALTLGLDKLVAVTQ